MLLGWRKCAGDTWCRFETAVLPDANASGILLVWSESGGENVWVAAGGIAKNLKWARQFEPLAALGDLLVSWASVPEESQDGVRRYLVERLQPVFRERPPADLPIPVNLPWDPT